MSGANIFFLKELKFNDVSLKNNGNQLRTRNEMTKGHRIRSLVNKRFLS